MKTLFALVLAAGLVALAGAQTPPPPKTDAKAQPRIELTPVTKAGAPAAKKDAKKDAKKKEDEIGKIDGMVIPRGETQFLGLQLIDGKFKLTFYNAKKKPVAPDVSRAALRWDPKYKLGMERTVLTPSGAHALASDKFVRPPYNFKLTIVLLRDAPETPMPAATGEAELTGETFVVDFRQ